MSAIRRTRIARIIQFPIQLASHRSVCATRTGRTTNFIGAVQILETGSGLNASPRIIRDVSTAQMIIAIRKE